MNFIIVGCGRVGAELAYRLYQQEHQVAVVDQSPAAFDNLLPDFRGRTVEGDGLAQDVLRRAGIEEAAGLAAVTDSDPLNAVVAHVAQIVYHLPRVVVRNYDSRWLPLHEAFGLPVVSSTIWGAQRIEELLYDGTVRLLFAAGNGEVSFYEVVVPDHFAGQPLQNLLSEAQGRVVALTRAGRALLPEGTLPLAAGDVIHVSLTPAGMAALQKRLRAGG